MYFLRNLNTVDPINLHANVFILGIINNKNTTKYAVYGCLQTVIFIVFIFIRFDRSKMQDSGQKLATRIVQVRGYNWG